MHQGIKSGGGMLGSEPRQSVEGKSISLNDKTTSSLKRINKIIHTYEFH